MTKPKKKSPPKQSPQTTEKPKYDKIRLANGNLLTVHSPEQCAGQPSCVIHNPSDHHMKTWPLDWRGDRYLMERVCEHGVGHPDPDHIEHIRRTKGDKAAKNQRVHGCDGCCNPNYEAPPGPVDPQKYMEWVRQQIEQADLYR